MRKSLFLLMMLFPLVGLAEDTRVLADCVAIKSNPNRLACFDSVVKIDVAEAAKDGFAAAKWGMSKSEVLKLEGKEPTHHSTDERLVFESEIASKSVLAVYTFSKGKLTRGKYAFMERHSSKNTYISEFDRIAALLEKRYGKSLKTDIIWSGDLFKGVPSKYGLAVGKGELSFYNDYGNPETEVLLSLTGGNFEVSLGIEYLSKKYKDLDAERDEKKNTKGL